MTVKKELGHTEAKGKLSTLMSPSIPTKAKKPSQISLQSKTNGLSQRNQESKPVAKSGQTKLQLKAAGA